MIEKDGKIPGGVLIVNRRFPSAEFVQWDVERRQTYMLNFVCDVLKAVCVAKGQDATAVDEARAFVLEQQFRRLLVGRTKAYGPDGSSSAQVECEQEMDEARVYISATLSDGQSIRVNVAKSRPDEFILQKYFGKLEWAGPRRIVLQIRAGDDLSVDL